MHRNDDRVKRRKDGRRTDAKLCRALRCMANNMYIKLGCGHTDLISFVGLWPGQSVVERGYHFTLSNGLHEEGEIRYIICLNVQVRPTHV